MQIPVGEKKIGALSVPDALPLKKSDPDTSPLRFR